jgi:hypothetical protein
MAYMNVKHDRERERERRGAVLERERDVCVKVANVLQQSSGKY